MKVHIEVHISLSPGDAKNLHGLLRQFAGKIPGWKFPESQSKSYQKRDGGAAGYAISNSVKGLERAAVAIANSDPKHPTSFFVPNIVPQGRSSLTLGQYNRIGLAFARDFRWFLRQTQRGGRVSVRGPEVALTEIIASPKCRRLFEAYLATPTPTGHPSDIAVLDRFTCAIFRYRAKVKLHNLQQHLTDDRKWNPDSAAWVIARVQTGLDILRVHRRF